MPDQINKPEFDETVKRLEAEDNRQNHRIDDLEESVRQINALTISVEKQTTSLEQMAKELTAQGKRLEAIEARDGETWRAVVKYTLTAIAGILVGYALRMIGIF